MAWYQPNGILLCLCVSEISGLKSKVATLNLWITGTTTQLVYLFTSNLLPAKKANLGHPNVYVIAFLWEHTVSKFELPNLHEKCTLLVSVHLHRWGKVDQHCHVDIFGAGCNMLMHHFFMPLFFYVAKL